MFLSHDTIFFEHIFPYQQYTPHKTNIAHLTLSSNHNYFHGHIEYQSHHPITNQPNKDSTTHTAHPPHTSNSLITPPKPLSITTLILHLPLLQLLTPHPHEPSPHLPNHPTIRKSIRISNPPLYLKDFQCSNLTCTILTPNQYHKGTPLYLISNFISYYLITIKFLILNYLLTLKLHLILLPFLTLISKESLIMSFNPS